MQDFSYLRDPYHERNRDALRVYKESLHIQKRSTVRREALKLAGYLLALLLLVIAATLSTERINEPSAEYCEMTALFVESKGEFGWPDFDRNMKLCET
jgi:hypothetical protein